MQKGQIRVQTENIFPIIKKFLYSEHEIFLRELISNATDASQKLKTLASIGEAKGELGDLRITPLQQVYFLQKLNEERLPFDVRHQRAVKRILPGDSTANWRIRGKTGWAIRVQEEYGWYVGWVERAGRTAYFAINIDMHDMNDVRRRQTLTRALLIKEGWLDPDAL